MNKNYTKHVSLVKKLEYFLETLGKNTSVKILWPTGFEDRGWKIVVKVHNKYFVGSKVSGNEIYLERCDIQDSIEFSDTKNIDHNNGDHEVDKIISALIPFIKENINK